MRAFRLVGIALVLSALSLLGVGAGAANAKASPGPVIQTQGWQW